MNKKKTSFLLLILLFCVSFSLQAQRKNAAYEQYISQYSNWAVELMHEYRIPASIKLAQGLLETGAGRSTLAREANNHFGIKCGSRWTGKTIRRTDDAPNECFRSYKNARESYVDHAHFLRDNPRYAGLFRLSITDYKGWAKGLKDAGYATAPSYANSLITIIETYELYRFDSSSKQARQARQTRQTTQQARQVRQTQAATRKPIVARQIHMGNRLRYVRTRQGDTFETLAKELGVSARNLRTYNDLHKGYTFEEGEAVYLQKKHKRSPSHISYTVRSGDSMHTISQMYGVRLTSLYSLNTLPDDYIPQVGDIIWLQ